MFLVTWVTIGILFWKLQFSGFGDTKILPRCDISEFQSIVENSLAYQTEAKEMNNLWNCCSSKIFSHETKELRLGLGDSGCSSYYSDNMTVEDIKVVQKY